MNVLLLDHAPVVGGAEVVLVGLAGALDRDRWTPLVATSEEPAFRSLLADVDVESIPVPMGHLNGSGAAMPIHLTAAVRAVSRLVRRRHIDLIHTNTVRAHVVGTLAATLTRTPLVWTLHDDTFPRHLVRLLARGPRQVICVSQWLSDRYAASGLRTKSTVVHNGVDLEAPPRSAAGLRAELGVPPTAPFVVSVGRLVAGKAPHRFVQAAQRVLQTRPEAYFALVGGPDGPEPGRPAPPPPELLTQAVEACGVGGRLIMTGHRTDVDRFYAAADVFVYTAVRPEGLPTVLLEAMRYSLPTVASAIGGAAEIVENGVTGWCVRPDDVDDLAGGVLRLLGDPDRARAMGVNGRRRLARGFDRREQVARTMGIYDTAVRRTTRG